MTRAPRSPQQTDILAALREADAPLSTTDLREVVNRGGAQPLVTEQVYRRRIALERHGLVRRAHRAVSRNTHWQTAAHAPGEIS
jgi:Fe2+ or Zn2+ uptake regulation protein